MSLSRRWGARLLAAVDPPLLLLIAVSLFLNAFWLWWGLPNGHERWATDSIQALQPLVAVKATFVDDWWNSGYYMKFPMGHFFVLLAAYAPYLLWLLATGQFRRPSGIYPYGFDDPETALTVLMLIANGVSALMGVGIVVLVYLTARDLFGRTGALFAALIVAFSPPFVFYAHTSNVDTPSLFWCALALYAYGRLLRGRVEHFNYGLLGFSVGMAAATKEQTYGLFVLVPLSVLVLHARHHQPDSGPAGVIRALGHPKILGALAACVVTFVLATHLIFNWDGNVKRFQWRLEGVHPIRGDQYPHPPVEIHNVVDALTQTVPLLYASMNPVLLMASLGGLAYLSFREGWARHFALTILGYFAFSIMLMPFLRARFVMELVLVLAFYGGRFLAGVHEWGTARSKAVAAALGLLLWSYSFAYGFNVDYLMMRDARYDAEAWLRRQSRPGATIEVYAQPTYLPRMPETVRAQRMPFSEEALGRLPERSPDFVVLTSAHYREFSEGSPQQRLLGQLLAGAYGYQPVRTFRRDPLVGYQLIPGLSPEIVVLAKR